MANYYDFTEKVQITPPIDQNSNSLNKNIQNVLSIPFRAPRIDNDVPVFTVSQASTLTNKKIIEPTNVNQEINKCFLYTKATPMYNRVVADGSYVYAVANGNNPAPSKFHSIVAHFCYFGNVLEVRMFGFADTRYRILIDGVPLSENYNARPAGIGPSNLYHIKLEFATTKHRLITIEHAEGYFAGINVSPTDLVYSPVSSNVIRAIALGDSVTQGQNVEDSKLCIWTTYLSQELGWDVWDQGEGGTGWLNPGPTAFGNRTFQDRISTAITPYNPNVILLAGGLNDKATVNANYTSEALLAKTLSTLEQVKTENPNAEIFVIAPFFTGDTNVSGQEANIAVADVLESAAEQAKVHYINTKGYVTTDNKSVIISNDKVHPTKAGQEFWGRIIAMEVMKILNS